MTLRQYIIIMSIATLFCWVAWTLVLKNIDPFLGSAWGFGFFYLSLFLALVGTISLIDFVVRYFFSRNALPMFRYVQKSFRDSFFVSLIIVILLFLQGAGYLRWWNAGMAVGIIILISILRFQTTNKMQNNLPHDNVDV